MDPVLLSAVLRACVRAKEREREKEISKMGLWEIMVKAWTDKRRKKGILRLFSFLEIADSARPAEK